MADPDERERAADPPTASPLVGFGVAVGLLALAAVGAVTAGVLDSVGPYLLGVGALLAALVALVALG